MKNIPIEIPNYNGYRYIGLCKIYSTDYRWIPESKELKALSTYYSKTKHFRLVIPNHIKIQPIKYDGDTVVVIFGSKKLKWVPTKVECEKLRKFLQKQFNTSIIFKNYKVIVKPIKLKENK